jgi:hypothetical protein
MRSARADTNHGNWGKCSLFVVMQEVKQNGTATRPGGAWGERGYSSYSFLTSALEGGEWSASRPGRALPPGKEPPAPIVQEAGWAPEPVWTQRLEEKSSASVEDRNCCYNASKANCQVARNETNHSVILQGEFLPVWPQNSGCVSG